MLKAAAKANTGAERSSGGREKEGAEEGEAQGNKRSRKPLAPPLVRPGPEARIPLPYAETLHRRASLVLESHFRAHLVGPRLLGSVGGRERVCARSPGELPTPFCARARSQSEVQRRLLIRDRRVVKEHCCTAARARRPMSQAIYASSEVGRESKARARGSGIERFEIRS